MKFFDDDDQAIYDDQALYDARLCEGLGPSTLQPLPEVPSTPLPSYVTGGSISPAWDPSSRTPGRHDDEEQQAQPSPLQLIKRPPGKPNRKGGYDLKEAAGLDDTEYAEIKVRKHFWELCVIIKCPSRRM